MLDKNCFTSIAIVKLKICFVLDFTLKKSRDYCASRADIDWAEMFAIQGHSVSILAVHYEGVAKEEIKKIKLNCAKRSIEWIPLQYDGPFISSLDGAIDSYKIFQCLSKYTIAFDCVHFPFKGGLAYYSLLAKKQGWAFPHTTLYQEKESAKKEDVCIESLSELTDQFMEEKCMSLADDFASSKKEFCALLKDFDKEAKIHVPSVELPLISVCLTHYNRPHYLAQALDSIRRQDYCHYEVVLVDDASTLPEAHAYLDELAQEFASKGWMIIRNKQNLFPGAARNLAANYCRGDYLLFMDDDNYAKPNEMSLFVQVALKSRADILTCALDVFSGEKAPCDQTACLRRFVPLGDALGIGLYRNLFGDINALIKRNVFMALKGLNEEREIGVEDWEFFARAVLNGYHLETIPAPLFWYRDTPNSITKTTDMHKNAMRVIRSYLNFTSPFLRNNLILSRMQEEQIQRMTVDYNTIKTLLKRCWQLLKESLKKKLF